MELPETIKKYEAQRDTIQELIDKTNESPLSSRELEIDKLESILRFVKEFLLDLKELTIQNQCNFYDNSNARLNKVGRNICEKG